MRVICIDADLNSLEINKEYEVMSEKKVLGRNIYTLENGKDYLADRFTKVDLDY